MPSLFRPVVLGPLGLALCFASPVAATPVTFEGNVVASCVLTVGSNGTLGTSSDGGSQIGSEESGGSAASLSVVATAGRPTITVGAPTMTLKPAAYTGTPTISVRYTSTGGGNQAYTSASTSYASTNILGDSLTINAKAVDAGGFAAGTYRLQTLVTCQQ